MTLEQLNTLLSQAFTDGSCQVEGDGYHFQIQVVSDRFQDLSKVKRQQLVYQVLNEHIASGDLHAITMKTFTQKEWNQQHG